MTRTDRMLCARPATRVRAALLLVALLALAVGCRTTVEPAQSRVFILMSIDGKPLPAAMPVASSSSVTVLHEELILDSHGVATRNTVIQSATPGGDLYTSQYSYTEAGGVLTLGEYICTGSASCPHHFTEEGPIGIDALTLTPAPGSAAPGAVLVYRSSP